jgi:hypothetical protein
MATLARNSRGLKVLGLALALTNLALWFGVVWLRNGFDALASRLHSPHRPGVLFGVQELLVYYDPWLARGVFPAVYTLGFVAIAFLFQPAPNAAGASSGSAVVAILLLSFETVWVFLIAFAILLRGPDWNFYWPWEAWDRKFVLWNPAHFSSIFWWHLAGQWVPHTTWVVREAPGMVLAVGYLALGLLVARSLYRGAGYSTASCFFLLLMLFLLAPLIIRMMMSPDVGNIDLKLLLLLPLTGLVCAASYLLFRLLRAWGRSQVSGRPMAYWRCVLLVLLVQVATLIPVKALLYWAFDMKYFIYLPEYSVNI